MFSSRTFMVSDVTFKSLICFEFVFVHSVKEISSLIILHIAVVLQSLSRIQLFVTPWTAARQASLSSTITQSCSNSCTLSQWCHPTISSFVTHFSSCPQSFPASGSFSMSWLFISGGQSIGASISVLPESIQGWFPLGLTGLSPFSPRDSQRVFSFAVIQKH